MRRHVQLRQSFETRRFDTRSWAIELPIATSNVLALVAEFALLLYDRSDQLSLLFDGGKKLIFSVDEGESLVGGSDDAPTSINLSRSDTEFVLSFLLSWYRDGIAKANHIDVELVGSQAAGEDCTLVIKAEKSQFPLPGDEAERILRNME